MQTAKQMMARRKILENVEGCVFSTVVCGTLVFVKSHSHRRQVSASKKLTKLHCGHFLFIGF